MGKKNEAQAKRRGGEGTAREQQLMDRSESLLDRKWPAMKFDGEQGKLQKANAEVLHSLHCRWAPMADI